MKKVKPWRVCLVLIGILLSGCGQTVASPETATAGHPPGVKTLIPTRLASNGETQTPSEPPAMILTTRAGQVVLYKSFMLEPNEYVSFHTEGVPQGIPLENGVEVSFDYINQADFGLPSKEWTSDPKTGEWPLVLTMTDGKRMQSGLGFKASHKVKVVGLSNFGYVEVDLIDAAKMIIVHIEPPRPIPEDIQGEGIMVETVRGDVVKVMDPRIFIRCMWEVYCCKDETLLAIPSVGEKDVLFESVKSVEFLSADGFSATLKDGQKVEGKLRESKICLDPLNKGVHWRLRGKAALGDFEIELGSIKKITTSSSP